MFKYYTPPNKVRHWLPGIAFAQNQPLRMYETFELAKTVRDRSLRVGAAMATYAMPYRVSLTTALSLGRILKAPCVVLIDANGCEVERWPVN